MFIYFWEKEREQEGKGQREGGRGSEARELDVALKLTNCEPRPQFLTHLFSLIIKPILIAEYTFSMFFLPNFRFLLMASQSPSVVLTTNLKNFYVFLDSYNSSLLSFILIFHFQFQLLLPSFEGFSALTKTVRKASPQFSPLVLSLSSVPLTQCPHINRSKI